MKVTDNSTQANEYTITMKGPELVSISEFIQYNLEKMIDDFTQELDDLEIRAVEANELDRLLDLFDLVQESFNSFINMAQALVRMNKERE